MFISIIKSCINKPVEHLNPVLSLDFEFLISKTEEEDDEEISNEISRILGHFGRRSRNYQERFVQERTFMYKDWHNLPHMGIVLQYTLQQGQSPSIPQYTT